MQSCGTHVLQKQLIVSVRRRDIKKMVKNRELRSKFVECEKNIMGNEKRKCEECDAEHISGNRVINNDNEEENDRN